MKISKIKSAIQTFEDLDAWKVCKDLRAHVAKTCQAFPRDERHRLADQLIRASRSATANIAEGYGRFHYAEYMQFVRHARGSLYEILDHIIVARDEQFIHEDEYRILREETVRAIAVVNGLIRYLGKAKTTAHESRLTVND